jgi:hypothetical protein
VKYPNLIEQTLTEKYPKINQEDYIWRELIKSQPYMLGWHDLIIELVQAVETVYKEWHTPIEEFKITDIKEKYGGLRVDCKTTIDAVYALIVRCENKSQTVCEQCGKTGKIRTGLNWELCLCTECWEAEKK